MGPEERLAALRSAEAAADEARALALSHFRTRLAVETKPDGSAVTEADTAIERAVRETLTAAHPDHAVLGEETGGAVDPARPTWVIDPIDATANFLRGVPVFATLIALLVDDEAVVGVCEAPALGERVSGARGHGIARNGAPAHASGVAALADAHVTLGDLARLRALPGLWEGCTSLVDGAWRSSGFADFWGHVMVAYGAVDLAVERDVRLWDIAAPACLVTEAGGTMTDLSGAPVLTTSAAAREPGAPPNAVVTSNGLLHARALAALAKG